MVSASRPMRILLIGCDEKDCSACNTESSVESTSRPRRITMFVGYEQISSRPSPPSSLKARGAEHLKQDSRLLKL